MDVVITATGANRERVQTASTWTTRHICDRRTENDIGRSHRDVVRTIGTSDFDVSSWVGILAPARTPRDIVDKLNRELNAVLSSPETVEKLAALGIAATPGTTDAFGAQIRADLAKYGKVVKAAGIKAE